MHGHPGLGLVVEQHLPARRHMEGRPVGPGCPPPVQACVDLPLSKGPGAPAFALATEEGREEGGRGMRMCELVTAVRLLYRNKKRDKSKDST